MAPAPAPAPRPDGPSRPDRLRPRLVPGTPVGHGSTAAPVVVDVADPDLAADVCSHVESALGWQVVRHGPDLPAVLRITDGLIDRPDRHDRHGPDDRAGRHPAPPDPPTVLVRRHVDSALLRAGLAAGALDVLAWPADADRLPDLLPTTAPGPPAARVLAVAGAGRGVGTSTTALAIGALHAWAGRPTVVVTDAAGAALAGRPAGEVPGVPRLFVRQEPTATVRLRPRLLVLDRGAGRRADVVVGRPDQMLLDALARPWAARAVVVTVGEGALRPSELDRVVGDRVHIALPWSFRVARAGLRGRVPGHLPGRLLAALAPAARAVRR